ncbi:hypothetical protein DESUT3_34630 [Desulfuromonas versatilis]|uniref:Calx-beta domain-containing protein n=1 Tax=Desulfuromonas versatilis TaxID=2802975 RepID=A0ABM8I0P2_9BACT|nr:DUF6701 domain-containing protein [Desulfuromonas versatilis]BCR06394.1 hypothetical protein DESUT3_34630 [Desulfuromonas versatilis]
MKRALLQSCTWTIFALAMVLGSWLAPGQASALCSSLSGRATINELYRGSPPFVEVKLLDTSLAYSTWTLQVCTQGQGCTGNLSLSSAQKFGPYLVLYTGVSRDQLDFSKNRLDVILKDGAGNVIDYLNVNNHSVQAGQCGSFPFATTWTGNTNSFSLTRNPDGNGPWTELSSGNSGQETPGNPNEGSANLPRVSVAEVSAAKGQSLVFVLQLDRPATGGESLSYRTIDDTAIAGVDYTARTGTVNFAAGATQATVSVPSLAGSASAPGVFFWLNLFSQNGLLLLNHYAKGTITAPAASVDHFRLEHTGSGLTCQRASVTVRACQNAACSLLYTSPVNLTLSPTGWIGGDAKTLNGGVATYELRRNTPGVVTLSVASASPAAANPVQCYQGGVLASCGMEFFDSGFIFDVPDLNSCQGSGNLTISAVRKDNTSQQCVAAGGFANQSKTVSFWSGYLAPATGTRPLVLNGSNLSTGAPGTGVTLNFDANARSTLAVSYADAGRMQLNARYVGSGEEAGLVMTGVDTFVVRPPQLRVQATTDGVTPLDNAGSVGNPRWPAGEDFFVQVRATCADGTLTPNFSNNVALTPVAPFEPAIGAPGGLVNGAIPAASFAGGIATVNNVQYAEVGNVTLQAVAADYLAPGFNVTGTSARVGRFTPHHFAVAANTPQFGTACAAGGFTYLGQPFGYFSPPVLTVTAQNKQNATTGKYTGAWWKITNASLGAPVYASATGSLDTGLLPPVDPVITDSGGGIGTLTFGSGGGLAFTRAAPVEPFAAEIALSINVADSDGIAYGSNPAAFGSATPGGGIAFDNGKSMRWGRLALQNAFGSELANLPVPFTAQHYAGGVFVANGGDFCTSLPLGQLLLSSPAGATTGLNPLQVNLSSPNTTSASLGPFAGGAAPLALSAPGSGGDGYVDLGADLSSLFWLRYDWDGDGSHDDGPSSRASFGIYKGNSRLIYLRESVQ